MGRTKMNRKADAQLDGMTESQAADMLMRLFNSLRPIVPNAPEVHMAEFVLYNAQRETDPVKRRALYTAAHRALFNVKA
jgi:hypothetical protein